MTFADLIADGLTHSQARRHLTDRRKVQALVAQEQRAARRRAVVALIRKGAA